MMISISAIEYDLDGFVEIDALPDSEYGDRRRRASRTATLDGGSVAQDFGYSHADRTMYIRFLSTQAVDASLKYLVEQYALLQVSADGGVFTAIPEYKFGPETSTLTLEITESLV